MKVFGAVFRLTGEQGEIGVDCINWLSLPTAILLALLLTWSPASEADILLLSSYHQGLPWTDELVQTFKEELGRTGISDIDIEYMDAKSIDFDESYTQALRNQYRDELASRQFEVIITTDDNAFIFAQRFREEIFHSAPIVFAGVSNPSLYDRIDSTKTVGVVEVNPYSGTVSLIQSLHPETTRILAIFDQTALGEAAWQELSMLFSRYPNISFERISGIDESLETIEERLRHLPDDTQVLFHSLSRDVSKEHISPSIGVNRISQASSRPVYAMNELAIQSGALGGVAISPRDQALSASKMVINILFGKPVEAIPPQAEPIGVPFFDAQQLRRFGISRDQLPEASVILNDTRQYRNSYGQWVLLAGLIIAALTTTNLLFYRNVRKRQFIQEEVVESNAELGIVANYDRPTALKNQYNFRGWIEALSGDEEFAVSVIDIDHFKRINESYSDEAGERVLCEVAKRLEETFDQNTNLYRLGDDEFGVVSFIKESELNQFISKLKNLFVRPFAISNSAETKITVSGGILHSKKLRDFGLLQKYLDAALIEAKRSGRNKMLVYRREYADGNSQMMEASVRLRRLVNQGKPFDFFAQPLVSLKTRQTVGYELLLRLTFEGGAPMSPLLAIKACESVGLLRELNLETFNAAAKLMSLIDPERYVTINLSRSQLMISGVVEDLIQTMNTKHQDLGRVVVEVTEEQYLEDSAMIAVLEAMKKAGVRLALDDFGSGYSSLTALNKLPLDMAKLDKHFLNHNDERYSLESLTHLRQLCSGFGLQVLAEGIEDSDDLKTCMEAGFDLGQGYLISCPLSFDVAAHFPRYPECIANQSSAPCRRVHGKCPSNNPSSSPGGEAAPVYPLRIMSNRLNQRGIQNSRENTSTACEHFFDQRGLNAL